MYLPFERNYIAPTAHTLHSEVRYTGHGDKTHSTSKQDTQYIEARHTVHRGKIISGAREDTKKGASGIASRGSSRKNGGYLLSHLRSTIGAGGLNFSVRNGKRWNPGAITTRMGDMMNATLYLQTTTSLKKCAEETKPRGFYAMIYRSFLFSLIVFATRKEVRLTAYTGMILFFPLSCASYI